MPIFADDYYYSSEYRADLKRFRKSYKNVNLTKENYRDFTKLATCDAEYDAIIHELYRQFFPLRVRIGMAVSRYFVFIYYKVCKFLGLAR